MPEVDGAQDIELAFTPAALTLPLRRLKLDVGQTEEVLLAALDLKNERLVPHHCALGRTGTGTFEFRDAATGDVTHLKVDRHFIVREWGGTWKAQK
jgi:hypothetical protein